MRTDYALTNGVIVEVDDKNYEAKISVHENLEIIAKPFRVENRPEKDDEVIVLHDSLFLFAIYAPLKVLNGEDFVGIKRGSHWVKFLSGEDGYGIEISNEDGSIVSLIDDKIIIKVGGNKFEIDGSDIKMNGDKYDTYSIKAVESVSTVQVNPSTGTGVVMDAIIKTHNIKCFGIQSS
jgi:hypothetical protein